MKRTTALKNAAAAACAFALIAAAYGADYMMFDWISGVRMDRLLLAEEKLFGGRAKAGREWKAGERTIRVAAIDAAAGTVRIQVLEGAAVKLDRVLGPVVPDRVIEDTAARKALVFEYGDLAGFLVPSKGAVADGEADLRLYAKTFSLRYGDTYERDPRFAVYPVGCPTGHNFGFMLVNKDEIRLAPGKAAEGPEKYFKIVVEKISGSDVAAWYVADPNGARSVNLGGAGVTNIDLVLGQGRVAGQAILKDVGRAMLSRNYDLLAQAPAATMQAGFGSIPGRDRHCRSRARAGLDRNRLRAWPSPALVIARRTIVPWKALHWPERRGNDNRSRSGSRTTVLRG